MSASIKITFATERGKDHVLTISNCPSSLEGSIVEDSIKDIIDSGALVTPYGKPVSARKAVHYVPDVRVFEFK